MNVCTSDCLCYLCLIRHHAKGCNYGRTDGPEDIIKECKCDPDEEERLCNRGCCA